MKRIVMQIAAVFGTVAMFVGSARAADITLTEDTKWLDGRPLSGTIDLAGHKLTVSSLTGDATIMNSADAGYEILEYIDSDGKAYINTGVTVANNTVIDIKIQLLQNPGSGWVSYVGARGENIKVGQLGGWFHGMKHYKGVTQTEGDLDPAKFPAALNTDYTVHLDKNGPCKIDEVQFDTGDNVGNDTPITVFGMNQKKEGMKYIASFRVYFCTIKYGDVVQRNLKPARRLSDGALGLVDVNPSTPVFYANANSTGAFTAGPVASDELVKPPAELHVDVAEGLTTTNSTVAIKGAVRVVKEGAGTFVAKKNSQTYNGGTDVTNGTFRCNGLGDSYIYGAAGSTVTVREGATFDFDGYCRHYKHHFVLDGGTIKSETFQGDNHAQSTWLASMTLTKNSFMRGRDFGFVGASWAEIPLQMNGCTLTVDVTDGRYLYMGNLKVVGGGEIYMRTGGWLALGGNPSGGKYVRAETTTLRMGGAAINDAGGEHVFGSYVSESSGDWDGANTVIKVLDRFEPKGTKWHATELQNGATLDLSDCTDTWNTTCEFSGPGTKAKVTFAADATINIELGKRVPADGMKLVDWTDAGMPASVMFKLPDALADAFMLAPRSDGLYVVAAVKTATWTGTIDTDCTKPENWICHDANGNVIVGALPGVITDVAVSGEVQLDIPANSSFSCASFTCDNVSLKGDCNWNGLRMSLSGSIDLAGHKLTVSSLTGDVTITSTADAGYEILEYIEGDGRAYVKTGVTAKGNTVIDIKLRLIRDSAMPWMPYVGTRITNKSEDQFASYIHSYGSSDFVQYWCVSKDECDGGSIALNTDYTVRLDKNGPCKINGVTYATGSGVGNDLEIMVFSVNVNGSAASSAPLRVYSCSIAYGDVVQRDLKPARRLSDGAVGLLDVNPSTPVFYANANSTGAFTAGPVVSAELANPAELHVAVTEGQTVTNSTVAIKGAVRVVKEGAGTFVATKNSQTYNGGTDVMNGTFRCNGFGDSYIYGAAGSTVTVREGATFDFDGYCRHHKHPFVLDGGTVKSDTFRGDNYAASTWLLSMALTKDSYLHGRDFGFIGASGAEIPLQMNGCTLTVDVTDGRYFYMGDLKVVGGGEIYMRTGGWLALGGNPSGGKYVRAETTTLRMGGAAINDAGGEHVFGSYVSESSGNWDGANTVIKVLDRFEPKGTKWHATELQNGATLDLSTLTEAWNVTCSFSGSGNDATTTFAEGATINVDLGDREIGVGEKVIGWTPETAPAAGVKFTSKVGKLRKMSDGAYYMQPFMIFIR